MNQDAISALIILLIACALFGCSWFMDYRMEGFEDFTTRVPEGMCGVDLAPCPEGTRCINGYCKTDDPPLMSPSSGLPVKPQGYIRL